MFSSAPASGAETAISSRWAESKARYASSLENCS